MPITIRREETGGNADERRAEANRILKIIRDAGVGVEDMTQKDAEFFDKVEDETVEITPKMLFWLRDIKERYAE
jgi:hypothetical protein